MSTIYTVLGDVEVDKELGPGKEPLLPIKRSIRVKTSRNRLTHEDTPIFDMG